MEPYLEANKALWNARTPHHIGTEFYDVPGFLAGNTSLKAPELALLGDITGQDILHLQCHFGQDTLSMSRMGARVTGLDLSDIAIAEAQKLAEQAQLPAQFVCADVYDTPNLLPKNSFDTVFTTYGTIGWLPDIDRWAAVISQMLRRGGRLVFAEFHPVVWMYDDDFTNVAYPYFNVAPIIETEQSTYADTNAQINIQSYGWNHSIADVLTALIKHGLRLDAFREYDSSPYNCFRHTTQRLDGNYIITHFEGRIPMMYALQATKL